MKNTIKVTLIALFALGLTACTDNMMAKGYGGKMELKIPCDTRVVVVTWKNGDLWYLLRKMEKNEEPRKYVFMEDSNWGAMEGQVNIAEHRCKK